MPAFKERGNNGDEGGPDTILDTHGGALHGSTFGVLEYLSQSNDNSDNVPVDDRYKFMDDLTLLEFTQLMDVGLASYNIRAQVPSNIPQHNQLTRSEQKNILRRLMNGQRKI